MLNFEYFIVFEDTIFVKKGQYALVSCALKDIVFCLVAFIVYYKVG
jgi:hypothetical protein